MGQALAVRDLDLDLDAFEGPFDLLLTLILKEELGLPEVDVVEIVIAFVERLERREGAFTPAQLEVCGEFLVLVAALLELKARELFNEEGELDVEELDPDEAALELAERLAEYRRVKAGALWLEERLAAEADRFFRLGPAPPAPPPPRRVPPPEAPPPAAARARWRVHRRGGAAARFCGRGRAPRAPPPVRRLAPQDPARLAAAIRGLAAEPPALSLSHMPLRYPPVTQFLERFRGALRRRRRFVFDEEVDGLSRIEQAVAFLALLELRKAGEVRLGQPAPFEPISVWKAA